MKCTFAPGQASAAGGETIAAKPCRAVRRAILVAALGAWMATFVGNAAAQSTRPPPSHWVGSWSAAMLQEPAPANEVTGAQQALAFSGQTLREMVRIGASGSRLRLVLDNRFGTAPVTIDASSVGRLEVGSTLFRGSLHQVLFAGKASVTLAAGSSVTSDPVPFAVVAGEQLGVSLHVPGAATAQTWHPDSRVMQFVSGHGDRTSSASMPDAINMPGIAWLGRIDVETTQPARAIIALGDSITNGYQASGLAGWTDVLQDRLDAARCARPVLNAGIDGNQVAAAMGTFGMGQAMDQRNAHDVLQVPGARYVILLGGINDIGLSTVAAHKRGQATPTSAALADPVIAAQKRIIAATHARGMRIFGGTVLPFEQTTRTYSAAGEAAREKINAWIRGPAGFDGVIDFDAVMRDPAHPKRLRPAYDSGDNLHPSDAGYRAMADAVPLALFGCP